MGRSICLAVILLAGALPACDTAPLPDPLTSPAPDATAAASPAPAPDDQQAWVPVGGDGPVFPLVIDQPFAFPGIYQSRGLSVSATSHFALIGSSLSCDELASLISAGEWRALVKFAIPAFDMDGSVEPGESPLGTWLYMERGDESLVARLGGDDFCGARLVRSSTETVSGSGVQNFGGQAKLLQEMCFSATGMALLQGTYYGADGLRMRFTLTVPVALGEHGVDELEITVARSSMSPLDFFSLMSQMIASGNFDWDPDPHAMDFAAVEASVVIESVDPLIGRFKAELLDEEDEAQSIEATFRCDAPPGQLAAAAEEAREPRPARPTPTPGPAAGSVVVTVASGPHAGVHEVTSTEVSCAHNLLGGDSWFAGYGYVGEEEPAQGVLQTLSVSMPDAGGRAGVMMTFGDDYEIDFLNDNSAAGSVDDRGDVVEFHATGRTFDGVGFEVEITCYDIGRF